MTNRDTYDIEEAERLDKAESDLKAKSTNIQPSLLIKLMKESEPCLFNNKSELAVNPVETSVDVSTSIYSMHPWILVSSTFFKMLEITRWHAQIQVDFWKELFASNSKGSS